MISRTSRNSRNYVTTFATSALIASGLLLAGCSKEKKGEVEQIRSADSTAVAVVVAEVKSQPYADWVSYPADLRGAEDAQLVTAASGTVSYVAEVGTNVRAGQALCNIESDRYKAQLDAAQAAVDLAQGEVDRTQKNVEAGSLGKVALDGAKAQLLGGQAQLLGAKKLYEESLCQAPFSGVVASRMINRWQAVGPGTPTLRLVRNDKLETIFTIPEVEASTVKPGMAVEFFLLDAPAVKYTGKVTSVDLAADSRSRTMTARALITNSGKAMRPGMVGRARILRKQYASALLVPSTALLRRERGTVAMISDNGIAREAAVQILPAQGDSVLVLSGLEPGDQLVVQGAFRVATGAKLTAAVGKSAAPTATATAPAAEPAQAEK